MKKHIEWKELIKKTSFILIPVAYLCFLIYSIRLIGYGSSGFYLLYVFSRLAFYPYAILTVMTYAFCTSSQRSGMDEVISVSRCKGYYQVSVMKHVAILIGLFQLTVIAVLVTACVRNEGTSYFLGYFWKSWLFNLLAPMVILLGVAYLLSRLENRIRASILLVAFLLMVSPVFSQIVWREQPAFPVDKILNAVLAPFRIFYENGNYAANSQLGLQTSGTRAGILLFWIFLLSAIIFIETIKARNAIIFASHEKNSTRNNRLNMLRKAIASILAVCAAVSLMSGLLPSGAYRINNNWNGIGADYNYYEIYDVSDNTNVTDDTIVDSSNYDNSEVAVDANNNSDGEAAVDSDNNYDNKAAANDDDSNGTNIDEGTVGNVSGEFAVSRYEMSLKFGRYMSVDAVLSIQSDTPMTQFTFTLYHGYTVEDITCEDAEITWEEDGDFLTISTNEEMSELTLHFTYQGSHAVFYSYGEGVTLPGWFPWYPMSGEREVMVSNPIVSETYNTSNRIEEANITLHIDADFAVVSNLGSGEDGEFAGTATSITLIGGEIVATQEAQVLDYLPLDLWRQDEDSFLRSTEDSWEQICDTLASYGLEDSVDKSADILLVSADIGRFYPNISVTLFDDYVLADAGELNIEGVSTQLFLAADSTLGYIAANLGGIYGTPRETLAEWLNLLVFMYGADDESAADYMEGGEEIVLLYKVLSSADSSGKGKDALLEIVQHVFDENATEEDQEFLERLCEDYAAN